MQLVMWIALRHTGYDPSTGSNSFHNNTSTVTENNSVTDNSTDNTNTACIRRRHDRYVDNAWGLDLTPRMYLNNSFALLSLVSSESPPLLIVMITMLWYLSLSVFQKQLRILGDLGDWIPPVANCCTPILQTVLPICAAGKSTVISNSILFTFCFKYYTFTSAIWRGVD